MIILLLENPHSFKKHFSLITFWLTSSSFPENTINMFLLGTFRMFCLLFSAFITNRQTVSQSHKYFVSTLQYSNIGFCLQSILKLHYFFWRYMPSKLKEKNKIAWKEILTKKNIYDGKKLYWTLNRTTLLRGDYWGI